MILHDGLLYLGCLYAGGCVLAIEAYAIVNSQWGELLGTILLAAVWG